MGPFLLGKKQGPSVAHKKRPGQLAGACWIGGGVRYKIIILSPNE